MARTIIRKSGASPASGMQPGEQVPVVAWRMDVLAPGNDSSPQDVPPPPVRPPEEELARIREEARAEAYAAGFASGLATGTRELAELTQLLGRMREVMEDHEQMLANDVMGLAVELSRQIMRHALHVYPEVVLPVVREAIASLPQGSQHPRLILHPQDAALVRSVLDVNQITPAPWRIVEDARLERGGCRIETAASELDASVGSRWKAVVASLGREDRWVELDPAQRPERASGASGEPAAGAAADPSQPREAR
ncbi:MAG: flagellar assembly protein FliH [Rhodocyclaceae bacterium]|nr:flagellar assembly protein FliH [Rhodocyclaceae bacterium]MCE2981743.1 flagellar assembly protein FliH [Betaproteobacteria bacterium]MCA3072989.1 flagellar assembly protein FliH [Rhodocyclaceae bacterium]MCA3088735.1 flagellar assembly protein FliH [Rhodocyclaceae bacterium]MCA3092481.1 flagellar assembly protein FliH [Rhodocyclaceae bacterium]